MIQNQNFAERELGKIGKTSIFEFFYSREYMEHAFRPVSNFQTPVVVIFNRKHSFLEHFGITLQYLLLFLLIQEYLRLQLTTLKNSGPILYEKNICYYTFIHFSSMKSSRFMASYIWDRCTTRLIWKISEHLQHLYWHSVHNIQLCGMWFNLYTLKTDKFPYCTFSDTERCGDRKTDTYHPIVQEPSQCVSFSVCFTILLTIPQQYKMVRILKCLKVRLFFTSLDLFLFLM